MQKWITLGAVAVLSVVLLYIAPLTFPTPTAPTSTGLLDPSTYKLLGSSTHRPVDLLTLNAPLLTILGPDGNEIVLQDGVECETFFFGGTANEFAAVGLDRTDLNIVGAIKAAGNDANLNISADRRNARLKNGQTVYYGAKIKPSARGKVTGVTFVLTTVPTSGVPDIMNNSFNIKYVESVGGRAGDVKSGSTSGKAYQVINPAGDFLYYFSFTAVVISGGIQTTIVPHYFGGAMVRGITPDRVQCCCAHTKKPLPRVPEITYSCWYGFAHVSNWFVSCFRASLAKAVSANTANVPCDGPEATGVEITITGDGFERIKSELTPDRIKITDEQGSVARVTQITEITNTAIKAKMDITACRPGVKTVKIEGAGGFTTLTLIKVVQDVPDTIVGQKRFQATRILGTQEKLALTTTLSPGADGNLPAKAAGAAQAGQNIVFADAKYQIYDVTCVTRISDTIATTTTTGGCNNIASTVIQGTCIPGAGEENVTVTGQGFTCTAPIRNADINLTADVTEDKETAPGSFLCVGETKPVSLTVSSPSTYSYKVTLSAKTTSGTAPVIQILDSEGAPILAGDGTTTLFSGKGSTDIAKNLIVKGLSPGTACLTATYCDATCFKCDTIRFTVGELETLTATSSTGKTVTDGTSDPNVAAPILYLYEDSSGEARLTLKATTNPATPDVQNRVFYRIDGVMATPAGGPIPPAGTNTIVLSTASGNRKFTIHAGVDCNGNGSLDGSEATQIIEAIVGRVNSLTVYEEANRNNVVVDNSSEGGNPVLQIAGMDTANISFVLDVAPADSGIMSQAMYKVTASDGQVVAEARFDVEITPMVALVPQNGATSFTVAAGLDCNGSGHLDPGEEWRTVVVSFSTLAPTIDLDIDSDDNNGYRGPNRTADEEQIEDDQNELGQMVAVNDNDDDEDGVKDFADFDGGSSRQGRSDNDFVRMILEIPAPMDLNVARIRLQYSASDPNKIMRNGGDWTLPEGRLRVWKKSGSQQRNPESALKSVTGDYVPPGEYRNLAVLGLTNTNRVITLYLEGIRPSVVATTVEDWETERITVEIDPDGNGPLGYISPVEAVRVTIIQTDIDVDTDRSGSISISDDYNEYLVGYKTWRRDGTIGNEYRPLDISMRPILPARFKRSGQREFTFVRMRGAPQGGIMRFFWTDPDSRANGLYRFQRPGFGYYLPNNLVRNATMWGFIPENYVPGEYIFEMIVAVTLSGANGDTISSIIVRDEVKINVLPRPEGTLHIEYVGGLDKNDARAENYVPLDNAFVMKGYMLKLSVPDSTENVPVTWEITKNRRADGTFHANGAWSSYNTVLPTVPTTSTIFWRSDYRGAITDEYQVSAQYRLPNTLGGVDRVDASVVLRSRELDPGNADHNRFNEDADMVQRAMIQMFYLDKGRLENFKIGQYESNATVHGEYYISTRAGRTIPQWSKIADEVWNFDKMALGNQNTASYHVTQRTIVGIWGVAAQGDFGQFELILAAPMPNAVVRDPNSVTYQGWLNTAVTQSGFAGALDTNFPATAVQVMDSLIRKEGGRHSYNREDPLAVSSLQIGENTGGSGAQLHTFTDGGIGFCKVQPYHMIRDTLGQNIYSPQGNIAAGAMILRTFYGTASSTPGITGVKARVWHALFLYNQGPVNWDRRDPEESRRDRLNGAIYADAVFANMGVSPPNKNNE